MADVMPPRTCDLLLSGGIVVTMTEPNQVFWPGSVAINGREIVAVGLADEIAAQWQPTATLDCSTQVVLPGLVNCHVHAGLSLLNGRVNDLPFPQWLRKVIWPFAEAMTERASYIGTRLGCLKMMKAGITTFADMWTFLDANAQAVKGMGLRAIMAPYGRTYSTDEFEAMASGAQRWNNDRLTPAIGVRSLYEWTSECLHAASAAARTFGLRIHIDAAETREGIVEGRGIAEVDALGLLRAGTILASCAHVTPQEIDLAALRGAGVALVPISTAKHGSGIAPVAQMKGRVPVGLGTDSVCSNDRYDLFDEMRIAVLASRGRGVAAALGGEEALVMATIGSARVLGLDHWIGSLEVGKRADVITLDLNDPRFVPLHRDRSAQVLAHILFVASGTDVDTVIVDGRILLRDGDAQGLDETELIYQAREISPACMKRAGLA